MNEELLKLAYQSLKRQFDNISKDSWIWTDFFEDEKVGFDYFKKQIEQDEDFACLQDETYYLDEDLDELAYDIAYEIALKLKENEKYNIATVNMKSNQDFNPYKAADVIKEQLKANDVIIRSWQEISETAYNSYDNE